jgi:riboflavin synthase
MNNLEAIALAWADKQTAPAAGHAKYGIVDTTFAVAMQGPRAIDQLHAHGVTDERIVYRTVPGFKDLGLGARRMLDEGCDIVLACGMAGADPIDTQCAQDASIGIQMCQQATGKPVLECIIHMDEAEGDALVAVVDNRVREHATNMFWMMEDPGELTVRAGTGQRQGFDDVGSLEA